jgi:hypothetical protein
MNRNLLTEVGVDSFRVTPNRKSSEYLGGRIGHHINIIITIYHAP